MSNPTTPFSWQMPTAVDLVTDLPADFEVFGQAVATSMQDLLGGTTGQILSKASNTDMDFTWITNDVGDITAVTAGTGISGGGTSGAVTVTNSMATTITTKGDLVPGTGSGTFARLAAGNNGEQLVADSSTSTGLRYQSAYNSNGIINGAFDIAQRGSSINTAGSTQAYTLDRLWVYSNGPSVTTSQQATSDTTNLPNIQYCARLQRQSGQTSTTSTVWNMPLETKDSIRFAGQTVTVSFYARKSATYTGTGTTVTLYSGTGTDQSGLGGYTGQATVLTSTPSITTTWTRFQSTATVSSTATELRIEFTSGSWAGTAGASDYFEITGVQLELGSIATTFKRSSGGTIQGELTACQRYYFRTTSSAGSQTATGIMGITNSTTNLVGVVRPPVTMRIIPSSVDFSAVGVQSTGSALTAISAITISADSTSDTAQLNCTSSGFTANLYGLVRGTTGAGYVGLNAEL